jgi:hypothetical protein
MMANKYLLGAIVDSTLRAICQSSNRFGYSAGSARDSAALEFTLKITGKKELMSQPLLIA